MNSLFVVEHESGELLDATGDGGYTVWTTRAEAQDALDTAQVSEPEDTFSIVEFVRVFT